ncbi:DUF5996 family protein [Gangjinia marincola]
MNNLPQLPLEEWKKSKISLHLIFQIIGKVRLKMTPRKNHWWYITHYISSKGFTTSAIPYDGGYHTFTIEVNVLDMEVEITTSKGATKVIPLTDGLPIKAFYTQFLESLHTLDIQPEIIQEPFDMGVTSAFNEITAYHHFDATYIKKFWEAMRWVDTVFSEFSGRFNGKTCPVQLYWHHMDLAITRFNGKEAPKMDQNARLSDKDAYSHECISFGFWAGDDEVREPAFYAYTYPSPNGIDQEPLHPKEANWIDSNGSPMAFYRYDDLLKEKDPKATLLAFLESSYHAGAKRANWDIEKFEVTPLEKL